MNEAIEDLLAEFIERREAGEELSVEGFAAEHPETGEELREALTAFGRIDRMFPESSPIADAPERIGSYRVEADLGRGGMGRVLRVTHPDHPERAFALKQLHPALAALPRARERFRREGELLARLDHPGVVKILAVEKEATPPYLVMDLVDGSSLAEILRKARRRRSTGMEIDEALELPGDGPTHQRAARIALELARAVSALHLQGLLHRDLKPANVVLREDGRPVLIDFGLAVHDESATLTASGDLLGTPHYMSPEQARGERADRRTDVYGLGVVLYEMLTLKSPHPGQDALEVLRHIQRRPVPSVRRSNAGVPRTLGFVVGKALSFRRKRRYGNAEELGSDLEASLAGRAPQARAPGLLDRLEDQLRFHSKRSAAIAILLLFVSLAPWLTDSSSGVKTALRAEALREATLAWVAEDATELEVATRRLRELDASAARIDFFEAQLRDELPGMTGDAAVDSLARGLRAAKEDDTAAAVEAFGLAAEQSPDWALPVLLLGRAARDAGDDDRAQRELTAAARLLPESAALALELAELHLDHDRLDDAKREVERVLDENAEDWRLWSTLAQARAKNGEPQAALEAVVEAMRLVSVPQTKLLNLYAATVDRLGDHEKARTMFREMLAEQPKSSVVQFNIAYSYDLECRLEEAREAYVRTLEIDPESFRAIVALAHLAAGSNRAECEACRAALARTPDLLDPECAERRIIEAIELDRCETPWLAGFAESIANRVDRREAIARALRAVIEDAEVDERVVRVERALRRLEGR